MPEAEALGIVCNFSFSFNAFQTYGTGLNQHSQMNGCRLLLFNTRHTWDFFSALLWHTHSTHAEDVRRDRLYKFTTRRKARVTRT